MPAALLETKNTVAYMLCSNSYIEYEARTAELVTKPFVYEKSHLSNHINALLPVPYGLKVTTKLRDIANSQLVPYSQLSQLHLTAGSSLMLFPLHLALNVP